MNSKTLKSLTAAAVIAVSSVFVSCSNDNNFYDSDASYKDALKAYKENFVKAFGQPSSTQSWDFSGYNAPAKTRGTTTTTTIDNNDVWKMITGVKSEDYDYLIEDFHYQQGTYKGVDALKKLIDDTEAVAWPYTYAKINIYPVICHGNTSKYLYLYFGLDYTYRDSKNRLQSKSNNCQVTAKQNYWYSIFTKLDGPNQTNNLDFNSYRAIDTRILTSAESMNWWVGYKKTSGSITKINLETCKLFTVNGHQYVAFNCDGDTQGDYTDLICRLDGIELLPEPFEGKRYMVEDLGGADHGDFDFNDIVFDVVEIDGQKKCLVRALGGTLDIEIVVGTSHWRKGANEGREKQFIVTKMYNTEDPETQQAEILDEFDVEGWDPNENNVSVIVYGKDTKYAIPFPENGDIPLMVATKLTKLWRVEKSPVPSAPAWFMED